MKRIENISSPVLGGEALVTVHLERDRQKADHTWISQIGKKIMHFLIRSRYNRYFAAGYAAEMPLVSLRSKPETTESFELDLGMKYEPDGWRWSTVVRRMAAAGALVLVTLGLHQHDLQRIVSNARHEPAPVRKSEVPLPVISLTSGREVVLQATVISPQPSKKHTFKRSTHMNWSVTEWHTNVHTNLDFPPFSSHTDADNPDWEDLSWDDGWDNGWDDGWNDWSNTPHSDYSFDMDYIY